MLYTRLSNIKHFQCGIISIIFFRETTGSICAALALILGLVAAYFYLSRNADRNLSAAESRRLNSDDCDYLRFFDNHDLWHFTSAAAIFMAFLALLTVDDDLLGVNRRDIEVY